MADNEDLRNAAARSQGAQTEGAQTPGAQTEEAQSEVVQAVVDRVLSWHPGATVDVVRGELEKGLDEVGETMPEDWLQSTAERISNADPAQSGGTTGA